MNSTLQSPRKNAQKISTLFLVFSLGVLLSSSAFAADGKAAKKTEEAAATEQLPTSENVRCEKLMGIKLADFKEALVANCNLNKPFSSSVSRILNDETYFYCCQKR